MTIGQPQEKAVRRRAMAADRRRISVGPRAMMAIASKIVGHKTTDRRAAMAHRRVIAGKVDSPARRAMALETAINRLRRRHGQKWAPFYHPLRESI
jgi:hypothetical protein